MPGTHPRSDLNELCARISRTILTCRTHLDAAKIAVELQEANFTDDPAHDQTIRECVQQALLERRKKDDAYNPSGDVVTRADDDISDPTPRSENSTPRSGCRG